MSVRVTDVLRGAHRAPVTGRGATLQALVAGGGGPLGSAVLERLLARRDVARVTVLVTRGFHAAMHGLGTVVVDATVFDGAAAPTRADAPARAGSAAPAERLDAHAPFDAHVGVIVFDRLRRSNGREDALLRPAPRALPALARWLHDGGVRDLVVVVGHDPAQLPQALKAGLAGPDEQAVTALGFDRVVFVRAAQKPVDARASRGLQRLADCVLAQLRLMLPQQALPVRSRQVAAFVAALAAALPRSAPGTRVVAPELLWQAARCGDPSAFVTAWLGGEPMAPPAAPLPPPPRH